MRNTKVSHNLFCLSSNSNMLHSLKVISLWSFFRRQFNVISWTSFERQVKFLYNKINGRITIIISLFSERIVYFAVIKQSRYFENNSSEKSKNYILKCFFFFNIQAVDMTIYICQWCAKSCWGWQLFEISSLEFLSNLP